MLMKQLREDFLPRYRPPGAQPLGDVRFRRLLGTEAWNSLPRAVRARFSRRLRAGASATYDGIIIAAQRSWLGWLLAQMCRLIGAPLPLGNGIGTAAIVSVTEDGASGGQVWTRIYARRIGFPQVIHSAKRFAGPTGLEEYLGGGFGIALAVSASASAITFTSDHYFYQIGRWRMRMPRWLAPGALTIEHRDIGRGQFLFSLNLVHPLFGRLMEQRGLFRDRPELP